MREGSVPGYVLYTPSGERQQLASDYFFSLQARDSAVRSASIVAVPHLQLGSGGQLFGTWH